MCSLLHNTIKTIKCLNANRTPKTFPKFFIHVRFEVIMAVPYEESGFTSCTIPHFRESMMFQKNIPTPSSRSKSKPSKKLAEVGSKFS
jgi:hypothetical protein